MTSERSMQLHPSINLTVLLVSSGNYCTESKEGEPWLARNAPDF